MTRVVLGSASPGRRKVLRQAGIDPLIVVSGIDEDAVIASLDPKTSAADVTMALAIAKAERVAQTLEGALTDDAVVIACDSMLYSDGRLHGKPTSTDAVRRQWLSIGGRSGRLYTGHCVLRMRNGLILQRESETGITTVHFATPSPSDLDAYAASGEPLNVAGGFTIDGLGGWFVDRIDGDPSNVVGLSLPLTRELLARMGLSIAALWSANPIR